MPCQVDRIDRDELLLTERRHSCASVGKITRVNAVVASDDFKAKYPRADPAQEFLIIDGYIDILLPSMASGAAGVCDQSIDTKHHKTLNCLP